MGCDVEHSKYGARIQTCGRRWKLEQGRGQVFLTVDSLRQVSKTWLHDEIAPLYVSLIPDAETEAVTPADHDRKKHEPSLPIELRAPRVKKGSRYPTDDEGTQHEPLHLPFRNWYSIRIAARGTNDSCWRRGEAERSDPQVQLDFLFFTWNQKR